MEDLTIDHKITPWSLGGSCNLFCYLVVLYRWFNFFKVKLVLGWLQRLSLVLSIWAPSGSHYGQLELAKNPSMRGFRPPRAAEVWDQNEWSTLPSSPRGADG